MPINPKWLNRAPASIVNTAATITIDPAVDRFGCRSTNANIMPGTMNSGTSPCQKSRMFREGEASARAMNSTIEYFASSDG